MAIQIKRIYEAANETDGARILIDRLWPRGVSKERAMLSGWYKDIAPSPQLREWFCHDAEKFSLFTQQYRQELATEPAKIKLEEELAALAEKGMVTLLYAAKDPAINHAVVLLQFMREKYHLS